MSYDCWVGLRAITVTGNQSIAKAVISASEYSEFFGHLIMVLHKLILLLHQFTEIKQRWGRLVLEKVTARESAPFY